MGGIGYIFFGVMMFFGMVQLSFFNEYKFWDYCFGYYYNDIIVKGFVYMYISGFGLFGLGDILVMFVWEVYMSLGEDGKADLGYCVWFFYDNELALVGYYKLLLYEEEVLVEFIVGMCMGYYCYIFNGEGEDYLFFDFNY